MHNAKGMSLVEIVVALAIIAVLFAAAAPDLSSWIQNSKIRTEAEAIQNGLQLAHMEAVHRNGTVAFQLVTTLDSSCDYSTTSSNWVVSQDVVIGLCQSAASDTVAPRIIQKRSNAEVSGAMTIAADQSLVTFNGLGRATNIAGTSAKFDISNPAAGLCAPAGSVRCLRVVVMPGGQVRMCDPALAAGTPQGC